MKAQENKLLILAAEAAAYETLIHTTGLELSQLSTATDVVSAKAVIHECNIILGDPPLVAAILGSASRLEWVQSSWAGVDGLCKPGLRRDYLLTGVRDVFGPLISEYVMTYLFMNERQVPVMRCNQLKQQWRPLRYRPTREITLGIAGLGSIGRHLAKTARHFGMRVIGLNRTGQACEDVETVYTVDDGGGFFEEPDYIVLTLPETAQTKHFVNAEKLKMMKPSAVLMNVGRGSVVNQHDLIEALRKGTIGGAVLDVFENEPLAADSPLWTQPNVYITPHSAANSFPADIASIFIENYERFTQGNSLLNVIDFESGY